LVSAALFLIADVVARQRRVGGDRLDVVDSMPQAGLLDRCSSSPPSRWPGCRH